jgi:hypothetical protein
MKNKREIIEVFPIQIETTILKPGIRKLDPKWKLWSCEKCGEYAVYKGKPPSHKKCPGHLEIIDMMGPDGEKELIECMRKEIEGEIKKGKSKN